ncbi:MAG: hypothetical protein FD155_1088 [Bacteroidetes bacterium]|nr:MAG: hypothetical protein FD155_1088 [Bacteroidota bacterium]
MVMKVLHKYLRIFILLFFTIFALTIIQAQSSSDLRINEILVINDSNYIDDFGQRNAWIEIFNTAYNNVNIAGMYLTDDPNNPQKYRIPKGDPITVIQPRNYLVFFADNHTTRGILHLNFDLSNSNYVGLFDVNGTTLIDEIRFPKLESDISYGRINDGAEQWTVLQKTTPKSNNFTGVMYNSGDEFVKIDPYGLGMTFVAMSVVFLSLILLYLVFKNTRRLYTLNLKRLFSKEMNMPENEGLHDISGEVNAAISMALYLYRNELHDHEETVLTIKKVARSYSPWSSKIYGLRTSHR